MCITITSRLSIFLLIFSLFSCDSLAANNFNGNWINNGSGNTRVGNLKLSDNKITIENMASYSIAKSMMSGKSQIYKVAKVDKKQDPNGCGPSEKATYIVISPLPPLEGLNQEAIYVYFYGGSHIPNVKELKDDPAVCSIYSYGRDVKAH